MPQRSAAPRAEQPIVLDLPAALGTAGTQRFGLQGRLTEVGDSPIGREFARPENPVHEERRQEQDR
jgi:hypothetical protein